MNDPFGRGAACGGGRAGGRVTGLRRGLPSLALGLALALAIFALTAVLPSVTRAGEPEAVAFEIDADALGELAANRIEGELRDPMIARLKIQGFRVVPEAAADSLIRTRIAFHDSDDRDYTVHIELVQAGGEPEPLIEWVLCATCTENTLVRRTLSEFDDATLALREQLEPPPELRPCTPPKPISKAPAAIGVLGHAGVGIAVSGLLVTGTGISLYYVRQLPGRAGDPIEISHPYAPAAEILMAVGSTTLGLGLSALITDLVVRRRQEAPPVRAAVAWSPEAFSLSVAFAL